MKLIFWPFIMIWALAGFTLSLVGRLIAVILGFSLIVAGCVLTATVIGALAGIPLIIAGGALVLRL
ncbi:MAG: hypothetical protein LBU86_04225 [Oscillospiraceae bacterium]|nr:hypothetical protein [Oscillospiraceae bacterium]